MFKKHTHHKGVCFLNNARAVGIEPTLTVLETAVLPLYDARNFKETGKARPFGLFHFLMKRVLLASLAILVHLKFLLYLLLVA